MTLAGLLMFRGGAWLMTQGRTVAPLDDTFQLLGGGLNGSIGGFWSWVVGFIAIAGIVAVSLSSRAKRARLGFPVRPPLGPKRSCWVRLSLSLLLLCWS